MMRVTPRTRQLQAAIPISLRSYCTRMETEVLIGPICSVRKYLDLKYSARVMGARCMHKAQKFKGTRRVSSRMHVEKIKRELGRDVDIGDTICNAYYYEVLKP